ncbi:MAG: hypothetical protein ABSE49_32600, partial [Polyangiaceae bacterium]
MLRLAVTADSQEVPQREHGQNATPWTRNVFSKPSTVPWVLTIPAIACNAACFASAGPIPARIPAAIWL